MLIFKKKDNNVVKAPCNGKMIRLEDVKDSVFSEKMLGDGCAFILEDGMIVSPVNGKVTGCFSTKHAIGITSKSGIEILIHIGLDTVNLEGEGFQQFVKENAAVHQGDPLIGVDLKLLKEKGVDATTMLVVTNSQEFKLQDRKEYGSVQKGESLFRCKRAV